MIKNIYIHISNPSVNFSIRSFCKKYKKILQEKYNLYYITIQDLFPNFPKISQNPIWEHELWLNAKIKKWYPDLIIPDNETVQKRLEEIINGLDSQNLLFIINGNLLDEYLPQLIALKKTFPSIQFHIEENTMDLEREAECLFNLFSAFNRRASAPIMLPFILYNNITFCNIKKSALQIFPFIHKYFSENIPSNIYANERDAFGRFLEFIGVPNKDEYFIPASFHPQVLAFLIALQEYKFSDIISDFYEEYDFLCYKRPQNTLFSYLPPSKKNHFIKQSDSTHKSKTSFIDCSNESLHIDFDHAKEIAKLLSKPTRKFFLNTIDKDYFPYCPLSTKTAYIALMLAENKINEEEAQSILLPVQGRIHAQTERCSKNPVLTVYTTCYNQKDYIRQCIDSVLSQKCRYPIKHLIIDDGSTDGTQEILKEYAEKYKHIELILHKFNNLNTSLFHILNNIKTKYASCLDGDDFFTAPNKLEEQINFLENNPDCGLCFHKTYIYYQDENAIKDIYPSDNILPQTSVPFFFAKDIINTNLMQSSSVTYRWLHGKALSAMFPFPVSPMDWALNILHAHNHKIGFINAPMSLYRRHKKAIYYSTEISVSNHLIKSCLSEIRFCLTMNDATNYAYHQLFMQKLYTVLHNFYVSGPNSDVDPKEYNNIKLLIEKFFPKTIQDFKSFMNQNGIKLA